MNGAEHGIPRRRLRRIERELRRSAPELASMLSIFSRLHSGEMMPGREQLRTSPVPGRHLLLWPMASIAFLVVYVAGGGAGAARSAAVAFGGRRTSHAGGRRAPRAWRLAAPQAGGDTWAGENFLL